ncbi:MAG: response regulator transcription factor [Phormidesmis sp.]
MADIVICAAQSVMRAGLSAMVSGRVSGTTTGTIAEVVGQVDSLQALGKWLQTQGADLAVVELSALGAVDLAAIFDIVDAFSDETFPGETFLDGTRLSVLGLVNDGAAIAPTSLLQLISTGTVSLLPVGVSAHELRAAIAAILSGFTVFHPDITEMLSLASDTALDPLASDPLISTADSLSKTVTEPLTPREIQVLNQLAGGLTNKAIAIALHISEHTVKFHISSLLSKLNVTSRTEAVTVGIRAGLVML